MNLKKIQSTFTNVIVIASSHHNPIDQKIVKSLMEHDENLLP